VFLDDRTVQRFVDRALASFESLSRPSAGKGAEPLAESSEGGSPTAVSSITYDEVIRRYSDSDDPLVASFVDAAQAQLYGVRSSDTVEPLLYELRSRSGYWIGVSDDAIRSSAQTICSIAEAFVAEAFVERLVGALEEDHSPERTGELLTIVEFVDYGAVEGDEMLRELLELAADV
jgi:hypothetical protein